ncbi:MAG: alanine--tRNA ligase [Patescibacteria group bacterium]|jgi:alanyl-tRNA synthetase|nr:alanine--tRNA ligase [Patescibacteria group bacterium]|tara:strand:+ start:43178 stop:45046 length:1869 start_codon:yes stop_codon:yes gene_type:complete
MTTQEIREKYFNYFKDKEHAIISPASLLPENDPTTLFTGSGMQPMVPYLLGEKHPKGLRLVDSQKCFRAEDIDEVGDNRHTTFFEMLGNWSLGDYFKKEQISWMFEFLTKELELDPKRLYISVFRGNEEFDIPKDDEAVKLWQDEFAKHDIDAKAVDFAEKDSMQDGRIFYYDDTKNWWSRAGAPANMPNKEPGGPDSEIFWDFGEELNLHESSEFKNQECHINCDCGRFFEIGNNVFMAYQKTEKGFIDLPNKNIDFGGGLERMAAAVNDNPDIFLIDVFSKMRATLEDLSGKKYDEDEDTTQAFRVILDHMRAAVFLITDSAIPSNKDQGYFTRRLIRRSVRFAQKLGIQESFTSKLVKSVAKEYKQAYPEVHKQLKSIITETEREEEKFSKTLADGLKRFNILVGSEKTKDFIINGEDAFDLFATFGFPIEMTKELADEQDIGVDEKGFYERLSKHKDISRSGAAQKFKGGLADHSEISTKYHTATHLLHAGLRKVLGEHVEQKGSNITEKRLRFDFSHPDKMTEDEIKKVEDFVNNAIKEDYPVSFAEMSVEEAKKKGALGLFESKYGEKVKLYSIGDISHEICGGPHVENTGVMGKFKITKEQSASAGIRRIKAILE